jgi:hypothetical protein
VPERRPFPEGVVLCYPLEDFDKMLKDEIQSYDPYGVQGLKWMMIMVPIAGR